MYFCTLFMYLFSFLSQSLMQHVNYVTCHIVHKMSHSHVIQTGFDNDGHKPRLHDLHKHVF